jgi:hypothetical protein|tara:strand:+ start:1016 stop:1441 length:426 start_codon:yes stop_codon:yes gene_type:complete
MNSKKKYVIKTFVLLTLLVLGYVLPTRDYFYPFVKFPMYGYSKTPDEMFQKHLKTILYFEPNDSIIIDPFDYGFSRSYFSKTVMKPFINGDTTAIDKLIKNTKLIYPEKSLHKAKVEQITYKVTNKGLEKQSEIIKIKNVH